MEGLFENIFIQCPHFYIWENQGSDLLKDTQGVRGTVKPGLPLGFQSRFPPIFCKERDTQNSHFAILRFQVEEDSFKLVNSLHIDLDMKGNFLKEISGK